ncbi:type VI secretion system Vgr family protein [Xanthomonas oryzae pv. oryzicola]|uniref:type VI secretion system Vgr family protein n=1 Tax=Xanthomonas oryzae TaxID=347 RepID=UPI000B421DAD|nr:type VI secretion system Vgr family protein [Xanthomonas oryzae]OWB28822.1 type IV secretion protein Rhs [Xanthomonas oryzae pv. oryzicola]QBG89136.1 type VI secretion system tip protein VgrG [Xanthomonas oryzae]
MSTDILQALLAHWSQYDRFLQLHTSLGTDRLIAESLDGWEAVDQGGFRIQVTALSDDPHLPLARLIGTTVLIQWPLTDGGSEYRSLHGHVVASELLGYNGGLGRVRLVIEPWLSFLRQRVDSDSYQDVSVIDISEQVFGYYARGSVVPAWRWELADRSRYLKRSLTMQHDESDFDFLCRLWAEEGIYAWFEHEGSPDTAALGQHTLVLADSNARFSPSEPVSVRFHQGDEGAAEGVIQTVRLAKRWRTGHVARASWDYRSLSTRATDASVQGAVVPGVDRDVAGPYAYQTTDLGERRARQHLDAQRVAAQQSEGEGSYRALRPGLRFSVQAHPTLTAHDAFICLRVEHQACANVGAQLQDAIRRRLGDVPPLLEATWSGQGPAPALHAPLHSGTTHNAAALADGTAIYRNRFLALPADVTYRPLADGHGARLHAQALAGGGQTAIVVGDGAPVYTDRDHRLRVQHHFQRGETGASWEDHPYRPNAPASDASGTWTRMMTAVGGSNWGSNHLPRVGQEVWIEPLEGQPDRPVAVAALYNGKGNVDAQHNTQAGGPSKSTGNAPAWFAGNTHAAVLTGFKTQDLQQSQQGTGGYRLFQFDDTAGQANARVATTDYQSGLTLGHLKQTLDNVRQADRGYGAEVRTDASGALRGGKGVLLSTAPGSDQMDASAASQQLGESRQYLHGLIDVAQQQGAGIGQEPAPDQHPVVAGLQHLQESLAATQSGSTSDASIGGGSGATAAWDAPHLIAHGADGLAAAAAKSQVWVANQSAVLSAGSDLHLLSQGSAQVVAGEGIALYTQGVGGQGRPASGNGITLHAAKGPVSVQAQQGGALNAVAQKAVTLASTQSSVSVQTPQRLLLNAAQSYLKMEGNDIELGTPGKVELKSKRMEVNGPRSASASLSMAQAQVKQCAQTMSDMTASSAAFADI